MNAFLDYGMGPSPANAQPQNPQGGPPPWMLDDWAMRTAQAEGVRQDLRQVSTNQMADTRNEALQLGARGVGYALREPTRIGIAATKQAAGINPGAQSYTQGGSVTLSSASAPIVASGTGYIAPGTSAVIPGATVTGTVAPAAGSALGATLGGAGVAYGAYSGITAGNQSIAALNNAQRSGSLTPEQIETARQQVYREGVKSAAVGGLGGAVGGATTGATIGALGGPIGAGAGAVIGAVAGAAGGISQSWRSRKKRRE